MTNEELDQVTFRIRDGALLNDARKLLRSIEISALREALEVVEKHIEQCPDSSTDEEVCWISADALNALEAKIRDLELK